MANTLFPSTVDLVNPTKSISIPYQPQVLLGTVPVAGSVSNAFDLDGWTQFALQVTPNGTILGGTVINIFASQFINGPFYPVAGTTGVVASTIQIGSATNSVISPLPQLAPLRYVMFGFGGTQSSAQTLNLFVK